jgi:hypothetical protein
MNPPSRKEPIFLRFFAILKIVVNGYNICLYVYEVGVILNFYGPRGQALRVPHKIWT